MKSNFDVNLWFFEISFSNITYFNFELLPFTDTFDFGAIPVFDNSKKVSVLFGVIPVFDGGQ